MCAGEQNTEYSRGARHYRATEWSLSFTLFEYESAREVCTCVCVGANVREHVYAFAQRRPESQCLVLAEQELQHIDSNPPSLK